MRGRLGGAARVSVSVGARAGRWLVSHRRWSLRWAVVVVVLRVAAAGVQLGPVPVWVVVLGVAVVPAVVVGVWDVVWPVSFERWCAGPVRRFGWRRWVRRSWPVLARECGLSVAREVRRRTVGWDPKAKGGLIAAQSRNVTAWTHPKLVNVTTEGDRLTLWVECRVGQTREDITAAVPAIAAAAGAVTARTAMLSPSTVEVVLSMRDVLASVRASSPVDALAVATGGETAPVVVGRWDDGTDLVVDVPGDAWHVAVQGATRSGKSALCYTLLGGYAARPDVLVCGLDPSGILLSPWRTGRGAGWIATGTADMSVHAGAIEAVVAQMDARIADLERAGVDKLDRPTPATPVVLVVLEEYPGLLAAARADDDATGRDKTERAAPRIERAVGRLVKEGAKVGVRLLTLAQRMSAKAVDTDDRSNFGLRATLRVDNRDAVRMLHDGADASQVEAVRQYPPGVGLIEAPGVELRQFRADLTSYAEYRARVTDGIAAVYAAHPAAFHAPAAGPGAAEPDGSPAPAPGPGPGPVAAEAGSAGSGSGGDAPGPPRPVRGTPRAPRKPRQPRTARKPADPGRTSGDAA
jgi:hypothetical protein